ncbi:hypothetical protein K438DRAFT_1775369 [Mycena galopus ATCC 62051]|nr:hypothetical protein K438DRAFT_1775369 [Mycena galopus ATCC 62051]
MPERASSRGEALVIWGNGNLRVLSFIFSSACAFSVPHPLSLMCLNGGSAQEGNDENEELDKPTRRRWLAPAISAPAAALSPCRSQDVHVLSRKIRQDYTVAGFKLWTDRINPRLTDKLD